MADSDGETTHAAYVLALVVAARDGDQRSFELLVAEFSSLVWSIAWSIGLDRHRGEDAIQATWLRLLQNLGSLRDPERIAGWIATTARRECLAVKRAAERTSPTDRIDPRPTSRSASPSTDPASSLMSHETSDVVRRALQRLDGRCQALLQMLMAEPPIPYSQIGATLALPVGSIGPTRARCLDRLKRDPLIAGLSAT